MSNLTKRLDALNLAQRRLLELELRKKGHSVPALEKALTSGDAIRKQPEESAITGPPVDRARAGAMRFSLFFFSDDGSKTAPDKYRLLLESARYADAQGFEAVWTPERHFQAFGGLYPNPSLLGAALAMITTRIRLRAGSVVLPLHNPIRVAEDWSVVDNLSNGRVEVAFASGWHPGDFILSPENYEDRREIMFRHLELVRKLWTGERVSFHAPQGNEVDLKILPRPLQEQLPVWVTSAGNPQTWQRAGAVGANILTGMQSETFETLKKKIDLYRQSLAEHGREPESGQVAVMLHTYLGTDLNRVKETVRPVMTAYMRTFIEESENSARRGTETHIERHSDDDNERRAALAFEYYFNKNSLLGTADKCAELVEGLARIGVDEIACLIDFGLDVEVVLEGLHHLNQLRMSYAPVAVAQSPDALT